MNIILAALIIFTTPSGKKVAFNDETILSVSEDEDSFYTAISIVKGSRMSIFYVNESFNDALEKIESSRKCSDVAKQTGKKVDIKKYK